MKARYFHLVEFCGKMFHRPSARATVSHYNFRLSKSCKLIQLIIKSTGFFLAFTYSPTSATMFSNWYRVNLIFNKSLWLIAEKLAFLSPFVRLFVLKITLALWIYRPNFVCAYSIFTPTMRRKKPVKMPFRNDILAIKFISMHIFLVLKQTAPFERWVFISFTFSLVLAVSVDT